jgi:hypothetical protein
MTLYIYLASLILTILIEVLVVRVLDSNGKFHLKTIALINLVTHPVLNFILYLIYSYKLFQTLFLPLFVLEIIVILIEWKLLNLVLINNIKRNFKFSVSMNISSLIIGLIII